MVTECYTGEYCVLSLEAENAHHRIVCLPGIYMDNNSVREASKNEQHPWKECKVHVPMKTITGWGKLIGASFMQKGSP